MPTLTLDHDLTCDSQAEPGDGVDRCVVAPGAITRGTVRIANGGTWPAYGTELHIPIPVEIGSVQLVGAGGARVESAWSTTSREIVDVEVSGIASDSLGARRLGSVAHALMHDANLPVTVVRSAL